MKMSDSVTPTPNNDAVIRIVGARQNNLKNLDLTLRHGEFTVITGPSGSGKSSLVFGTLYAEGQRRYVETFSPYARQFLDRMDRPHVDRIEGVPPAIAIDQNCTIRTSRSTVGTMTELNDHIKLLFAHHASLFCPKCGREVTEHTPQTIWDNICERLQETVDGMDSRVYVTFTLSIPQSLPLETATAGLSAQGFTHIIETQSTPTGTLLTVASDRFKPSSVERVRAIEAIEQALDKGAGAMSVYLKTSEGFSRLAKYQKGFVCADCDLTFNHPTPSLFSFNSAVGACEHCKGFGRIITVDPDLIIPDPSKTLEEGVVKPWTTSAFHECEEELLHYAKQKGVSTTTPYEDLPEDAKKWIWDGDPEWRGHWKTQWYGIHRFFDWLETKAYKMHVRMLLSRYRSYTLCPTCHGSHLKQNALLWRYGTLKDRQTVFDLQTQTPFFKPLNTKVSDKHYLSLPGLNFHELASLSLERLLTFFKARQNQANDAERLILDEICCRLQYLCDVGLSYLTLDRQSRTLSGGEVQRVSLTTALGTALVNTLFVLDEPSIGLHPRDMHRVNQIMRRLTSAGNTLVVVEHDPQVMLAADRLIDLGPGAGVHGGQIVFDGSTRNVLKSKTLTASYLSGQRIITRRRPQTITPETPRLVIKNASEHNLKHIDVAFPMGALTVVAGVSGSGKSTLIADILVPALERRLGKSTQVPGKFESLEGALPHDILFVDQSPIGRTTRSNPVSYVGSFEGIRRLFAKTPVAQQLGFGYADFSFNQGKGRCPTCGGSGYEHVEMQFLSDVYLPCPTCQGKRYNSDALSVTIHLSDDRDYNIADVLELTAREALTLFRSYSHIALGLHYLCEVGLGYLKLGQPLTTLSGGERQRLKLASALSSGLGQMHYGQGKLFVFDEPTTGLHFSDTEDFVKILDTLVAQGHSVIVIEHNLDVISTADWIIELGPEGGEKGGAVVFEGTSDELIATPDSLTGQALAAWKKAQAGHHSRTTFFDLPKKSTTRGATQVKPQIEVLGAREHNLKNLSVNIPRNQFSVITGPSGSGKSTLAFDLIFAEGQRRYLESLNAYARSMVQPAPIPDVDSIRGIPPTVAIEQRTSRGGLRSTVGTMTELLHFLRLLFVKLGTQYCPDCHISARPLDHKQILKAIRRDYAGQTVTVLAPIIRRQKGIFRAELEAARNRGFSIARIDGRYVSLTPKIPSLARYNEHDIDLPLGMCDVNDESLERLVENALIHGHGRLLISTEQPVANTEPEATRHDDVMRFYSTLAACPSCLKSFPPLDPKLFSYNAKAGACPLCSGYGIITAALKKAQKEGEAFNTDLKDDENAQRCPACQGTRLNPIARTVYWENKSIADFGAMTIDEVTQFFDNLKLEGRDAIIAKDPVAEIRSRLAFLRSVGLGYLTLDRSAPTLSGGESQRIRLAAQLGSNLRGVCYVLDEPTIGLHPRDNSILLNAIEQLTHQGNTLIVVEHDEDTIRRADHIIDIGPGSGVHGGELVAQGSLQDILECERSLTGKFLKHPVIEKLTESFPFNPEHDPKISIINPKLHNLKGETIEIPLNRLTVVTGVSGSGKSTLTRDILFDNLANNLKAKDKHWVGCDEILYDPRIARVLEVDQTPIGSTPRSCPATYVGFFDKIRKLFAETTEGKARGYTISRFSFNTTGGRCEACAGQGMRTIEMSFLPDVKVPCEVCHGARFNPETLAVTWKDRTIGDILQMQIDDALEFFESMPSIRHPLQLLKDIGLGYLTLGQPSPTLSGGEAQRIKLVTELSKVKEDIGPRGKASPHTLYVLDEPTVGLHMADVAKLIKVLQRLVKAGNTVVVVEHNLDLIACADWLIDMGPEGGNQGGQLVAAGTPQSVAQTTSHTGKALKAHLEAH